MTYRVGRERTMENKPDGEESSAAWMVYDDKHRGWIDEDHQFVVRLNGRQVMPDDEGKALAERLAAKLNATEERLREETRHYKDVLRELASS